ncbi:TadE/TadG family type IV pilus assembly protein [Gryllotalpicola reticulitermitis]|uniref:TadE/TadG family type IV pilus assembly protein n=1 Tax=Gryllotalpicola reticulitermitis TaxID=1184153 RepID=A0ABV8QBS6_9MICO
MSGGASDRWPDELGSAIAEFVMVAGLLVMLLLAVVQFTVVLLVRNTVQDAAAQGARVAAFADASLDDGVRRTRQLIAASLGPSYAGQITARYSAKEAGDRTVEVRVDSPLPVIGLIGFSGALAVSGHAAAAE